MSVLATDDFERANGPLGANWGTVTGLNSYVIDTTRAVNSGSGTFGNRYTAVAAPANQYAKCVVEILTSDTDEGPGPMIRMASGQVTGYFLQCNTTEIRMYKVVDNSFTQLGTDAAAAAVNDIIEIRASGDQISGWKNSSLIIGPITDSAIASGDWGIWGSATGIVIGLDDWEGGDLGKTFLLNRV